MRLLNAKTFAFKEFMDESELPGYAILSHTWGVGEVSYRDLREGISRNVQKKEGFEKIRLACEQACAQGIDYCWIDTCCIDKSSSAELSEAINSMFRWYEQSEVCYAYLIDVLVLNGEPFHLNESRWFTRGWTLQELIAPRKVEFYGRTFADAWKYFGERQELAEVLSDITSIDIGILQGWSQLKDKCIARRMSWAASRKTTRVEDQAYSLLGIFDVNMPLLYGEGDKAFLRLQEHIIQRSTDDSILAWEYDDDEYPRDETLFAPSPASFEHCKDFLNCRPPTWADTLEITTLGMRFKTHYIGENALPKMCPHEQHPSLIGAALLICYSESSSAQRYALKVRAYTSEESGVRGYSVWPSRNEVNVSGGFTRLVQVDRIGGLVSIVQGTHMLTRRHLPMDNNFRLHIAFEPASAFKLVNARYPEDCEVSANYRGSSWSMSMRPGSVSYPFSSDKVLAARLQIKENQESSETFTLLCEYQRDDIRPHTNDDGDYGVSLLDEHDRAKMKAPREQSAKRLLSPRSVVVAECNMNDFEGRTLYVLVEACTPSNIGTQPFADLYSTLLPMDSRT